MPYGFQTSQNGISIDGISSEANTLRFHTKLSASSGTAYTNSICNPSGVTGYSNSADYLALSASYDFSCPSYPVIFVYPTADGKPIRILGVEDLGSNDYRLWIGMPNGTMVWDTSTPGSEFISTYPVNQYTTSDILTCDFYIFSQTTSTGTDQYGIRMWDKNGNVSFDTSNNPLKFSDSAVFPTQDYWDLNSYTMDSGMTKPAYLARINPATNNYYTYNVLYGAFVNVNLHSWHTYVSYFSGAMGRFWASTAVYSTGYPGTYGNGASVNFDLCIDILEARGINITNAGHSSGTATANWTNVSPVSAEFYTFIDGADYD